MAAERIEEIGAQLDRHAERTEPPDFERIPDEEYEEDAHRANGRALRPTERVREIQAAPLAPPATGNDWHAALAPSGSGFAGDERNILIALRHAPELQGLVRYNAMALDVELTRSTPWRKLDAGERWGETDDTHLIAWLQSHDLKVRNRGAVADCVAVVAQESAYHPVRDYLTSVRWDGSPRLRVWLAEYMSATGNPEYQAAIGLRFLVSAVARILRPGCQADHVIVFEGGQGTGKTSAARTLAVRPEWFAGDLPDIQTKDAPLQLIGRWIIEIAELKAVRNTEVERTKSFITQTVDTFRPPYGRRTAQFPRQCVFIATTNESEYLRDRTGNRRYWPVRCNRIDLPALARDRDQLWAEAVHEFHQGTQWHLTDMEGALATRQQSERMYVTELEQDVATYLDHEFASGKAEVTVRDVLIYGLGLDPVAQTYPAQARQLGASVAEAMERSGWLKVGRQGGGSGKRTVYRKGA